MAGRWWPRSANLDILRANRPRRRPGRGRPLRRRRGERAQLVEPAKVARRIEHARILDAHLLINDDLYISTVKRTVADHVNAEWALKVVVAGLKKRFRAFEDPYFQDRARDVEDVGNRIQRNLAALDGTSPTQTQEDHILRDHDLSPSDTALMDSRFIKGVAIDEGGRTSHTGIIAKSLRIPAVVGLKSLARDARPAPCVVVDGGRGPVVWEPSRR